MSQPTTAPHQDTEEIAQRVLELAGARFFRWFVGGGAVMLVAMVGGWVRFDGRLSAVESRNQKDEAHQAAESLEIRQLTRKVDSLTIILANQTELLRELNRRVR